MMALELRRKPPAGPRLCRAKVVLKPWEGTGLPQGNVNEKEPKTKTMRQLT